MGNSMMLKFTSRSGQVARGEENESGPHVPDVELVTTAENGKNGALCQNTKDICWSCLGAMTGKM